MSYRIRDQIDQTGMSHNRLGLLHAVTITFCKNLYLSCLVEQERKENKGNKQNKKYKYVNITN